MEINIYHDADGNEIHVWAGSDAEVAIRDELGLDDFTPPTETPPPAEEGQ